MKEFGQIVAAVVVGYLVYFVHGPIIAVMVIGFALTLRHIQLLREERDAGHAQLYGMIRALEEKLQQR